VYHLVAEFSLYEDQYLLRGRVWTVRDGVPLCWVELLTEGAISYFLGPFLTCWVLSFVAGCIFLGAERKFLRDIKAGP
jgi:hypothetical protein